MKTILSNEIIFTTYLLVHAFEIQVVYFEADFLQLLLYPCVDLISIHINDLFYLEQ